MKKMATTFLALSLFAGAALAQGPGRMGMRGSPDATPSFDALKSALNLTDQQIASLQALNQERATAVQKIAEGMRTQHEQLREKLSASSPNPTELGNILLSIHRGRTQLQQLGQDYNKRAVSLLTSDQAAKLKQMQEAVQSRRAIGEAHRLNLITPPEGDRGQGPAAFGRGGGFGTPMGRRGTGSEAGGPAVRF